MKLFPVFSKFTLFPMLLVIGTAYADEQIAFTTEQDFLTGIPVVLTATRLAQSSTEAPSSITVIDRALIRASGAQEIADLFRLIPGFQVALFSNNTPVVTTHGFVGNWERRLQILVDGRSVYIPLLSTVDWATLGVDIDDIERIEVVRGSNSPAYGANAFSGVISIITQQAFATKGTKLSVTAGSNGIKRIKEPLTDLDYDATKEVMDSRKVSLRHGSNLGGVDYRVSLNMHEDQGFANVNDGRDMLEGSFRANYNPTLQDSIELQGGYSGGDIGAFNDPADPVFDKVRDKGMLSHFQSVQWDHANAGSKQLKLHFYHNYFREKDKVNLGKLSDLLSVVSGSTITPDFIPVLFDGKQDQDIILGTFDGIGERYDLEMQYTESSTSNADGIDSARVVLGLGLRQDSLKSISLLGDNDTIYDHSYRVFGNLEWSMYNALTFNAGVMLESNSIIGEYASPRLAVNYRINENHMLRTSATRAFRTPSLLEENINWAARFDKDGNQVDIFTQSQGNLKAEKMTDFELGYIFEKPEYFLTLDSKLFLENIRDGILDVTDYTFAGDPYPVVNGGDATSAVSKWDNVTKADIKGFEVQLRYRPRAHSLLSVQYAYAECTNCTQERYRSHPTRTPIRDLSDTVPQHTLSMLLAHRLLRQVDASIAYYHMSNMRWMENGEAEIPAYDRWDARLAKTIRFSDLNTEWSAVLQSFTGTYIEFNTDYVFETRLFLQFSLEI